MTVFVGRFQQLAKPGAEWAAANPVLLNGEIGVSDPGSATPILKIGDGVRQWSVLPPISGAGGGGPDYVVGTTTTLAPGSFATVTIDNSVDPPTISFGIPRGNTGPANTLAIGTTTTGAPGTPASATITGTPPAQTLNLVIPQGAVGPDGAPGADGATGDPGGPGPANNLTIGTVTTGAPGTPADATITGTPPAQELNLTIPRGADGAGLLLADPTGTIGLTMVPGVAATTSRSDSSPPLSQAIVPTWTATHTFTLDPQIAIHNAASGANARTTLLRHNASVVGFAVSSATDAAPTVPVENAFQANRTGLAWSSIVLGNATDNPAFSLLGTGVTSVGGQIVVGAPSGGATGTGTVNATAFYDDGVQLVNATAGNPSAMVGLAAVNGSGVSFMRSDAAPALSQAIVPTWTGMHTFSGSSGFDGEAIRIVNASPMIYWQDTDAGGNTGIWVDKIAGTQRRFAVSTDSGTYQDYLLVTRVGGAVSALTFGNAVGNPAFTFMGTGLTTFGGAVSMGALSVTVPDNAIVAEFRSPSGKLRYYAFSSGSAYIQAHNLASSAQIPLILDAQNITVTGPLLAPDGNVGAPVYSFTNDHDTGIYRQGADNVRIAAGGLNIAGFGVASGTAVFQPFGPIQSVPDGSAAAPIYSFNSDPDTGLWRRGSGDLAIAINGVLGVVFSATQNAFAIAPVYVVDGTVALPGIAFNGDTNTGLYRPDADSLDIVTGGNTRLRIQNTQVYAFLPIQGGDGSAAIPMFGFYNDSDTGMYRVGPDLIGIASAGAKLLEMGGNYLTILHGSARAEIRIAGLGRTPGTDSFDLLCEASAALVWQRANLPLTFGTNGAARVTIAAAGDVTCTNNVNAPSFTTTSGRASKRETGAPRYAADILARLRPILYRLLVNDDREQLGLIAEEVHAVCPQLSDGATVSYDRLAILLLAAWQDEHAVAA